MFIQLNFGKMKKIILFVGILFVGITVQAQITVNENPYPLIECDDNDDGFAYFNLHQADADIALGDTSFYFTYHKTLIDAASAINALNSPYMNEVIYSEVIFARAEDNQGIFAVVELELHVVPNLPIMQPIDLVAIDDDGDGIAFFDLTENNAIVLENLNPSIYTVSYYETQANAEADQYVIADPTSYQNMQNPQTIYVRIDNISGSCVSVASFLISTESLSINSLGLENLKIFPNPTSGMVTFQLPQISSKTTVSLFDILGKRILFKELIPQNNLVSLDLSSFKTGIYIVKISSQGNEAIHKLIKK